MPNSRGSESPSVRVLLIEDDPVTVDIIRICIEAYRPHMRVISAGNGQKGVELISSIGPHLVIIDLGLPDMDGMEVLERARQFSRVPVLILSARGVPSTSDRCMELGADGYMAKPFHKDDLLAEVDRLLPGR